MYFFIPDPNPAKIRIQFRSVPEKYPLDWNPAMDREPGKSENTRKNFQDFFYSVLYNYAQER